MRTIVAVDPGQSGGIAVRWFGKTVCWGMPETQGDLLERLREIKRVAGLEGDELVCVLEEVSGFAGKAQPGSAMFRFGEHFGFIKGVVQALEIRLVLVRPQVWQKGFGLGTASACQTKSEWKNKLKAEAQRRFPHLNVTLKTADALLILEHWISVVAIIGINGMNALSKVMGFLILCIGIQFVVNGVLGIVKDPAFIHAIRDSVLTK